MLVLYCLLAVGMNDHREPSFLHSGYSSLLLEELLNAVIVIVVKGVVHDGFQLCQYSPLTTSCVRSRGQSRTMLAVLTSLYTLSFFVHHPSQQTAA